MANIAVHGKNLTSGQPQYVGSGDTLTDEEGTPISGGFAASYAYFQASSETSTVIQWSKLIGTSDITVASGVITVNTTGTYYIESNCTSSNAATRDLSLRVPSGGGGTIQATATENQANAGGSKTISTVESFTAADTFDVILSAGIIASNTSNHLWITRVA